MSFVVLDTDVTSKAFKHRDLPSPIVAAILHNRLCITFVTLAELTKWAVRRQWSPAYQRRLDAWLSNVLVLPYNNEIEDVARTWGVIAAHAENRGRPRPQNDMWVAACCLYYKLPLATLNVKDFQDFADHEGLTLVRG
ncbi:MAG TPA: type II toxin-antitoxin system VapC family toxin [Actinophytocola sp.]|uniref:type II toxin-antitoxin system VapC family toxin n=1 Tax=Actinophytocola sp. TaxID=1872138 RepID=UPI002DDCE5F3|nr:type II toxin-antitoxin system VapC family toxin [Actinophytocola sp.]HEV2780010.1 type II toxin-antitoxin system VapC family toxin [Actinophytocola sp.]